MKNNKKGNGAFGTKAMFLQAARKAAAMLAVTLAFGLVLTGCDDGNTNTTPPETEATLRYETVPYSKTGVMSAIRAARAVGDDDWVIDNQLIWSAYDDTKYYYVFLLGHVTKVPLAYRQAVVYNGTTPVTIGYSKTEGTDESIMNSITTANENSTTESMSHNWGVEAGVEFDVLAVSASFSASAGGDYGWDTTNTRSYSDTRETVRTKTSSETDDISMTIGENGEPAGKYRYSLFGVTDVYGVVITDHSKTVEKKYLAYSSRKASTLAWGIDYEPDMAGDFGKTAPGALFEIPQSILANLPTPESNNVQPLPEDITATPVATPVGNLATGASAGPNVYETKVTVTLTSGTANADFYYTTDGNTPTSKSTKYTAPLEFTTNTTLKAIAIAAGKEKSTVLTETYTITEQPLQTQWKHEKDNINSNRVEEVWGYDYFDVHNFTGFKNFDIPRLKAAGYTGFEFDVELWITHDDNLDFYAKLEQGGGGGGAWASIDNSSAGSGKTDQYWHMTSSTVQIDNFSTGQFAVGTKSDGGGSDNYTLTCIRVTITAKK